MSGAVVGSAEFELRATRKKLGEDIQAAERDLNAAMGRVERDADRTSKSIGSSMGRMTKGLAVGFAALTAVATTAVAMVIKVGSASLQMADDLANSASRIGMSTTALQEWQHVAKQSGSSAAEAASSLEGFASRWEQAQAGLNKEASGAFGALLLGPKELRGFKDAEEALDEVISRIGALKSEADRAAIAEKLGLGAFAAALREGSDEVNRLRDEAESLGLVMDEELIRKGAAAQGQLDTLSQVIGIQMAEAFINLSDEVLAFTDTIADAIKKLSEFTGKYAEARRQVINERGIENPHVTTVLGRQFEAPWVKHLPWVKAQRERTQVVDQDDPALLWQTMPKEPSAEDRPARRRPAGSSTLTAPAPKASSGNNRAEREAEREARRAERVEQEIFRARQRALGIYDSETMSLEDRYDASQAQLKLEREAEQQLLDSRLARKELTQAEYDQLKTLNEQNAALEDRVSADVLARDLADERLAAERMIKDHTLTLLGIMGSAATTEDERRKVERDILKLKQEERRRAYEAAAADKRLSPKERKAAQQNLAQLPGMERAENTAFDRGGRWAREAGSIAQGVKDDDPADLAARRAEMYAEIDRLRKDDWLSEEQAAMAKRQIDADLNAARLAGASDFFGNLSVLADSSNKELAALGKAAAIAQATIDGYLAIQKAYASAPYPFNIAAAAAVGVMTATNIARIAGVGFAEGGYTGSGGKYEPAGVVHRGEIVWSQSDIARAGGIQAVEAMRRGLSGYAGGGVVGLSMPALPRISAPATDLAQAMAGPTYHISGNLLTPEFWQMIDGKVSASESNAKTWAAKSVPGITQARAAKQQQHTIGRRKR